VKRNLFILAVAAILVIVAGCSSGTQKTLTEIGENTKTESVQDSRGFEKQLTPAEIAYQSAEQFLSMDNYTEAIANLRKATALKPDYLEAWSELGNALTKIKDFSGGIDAYKKALELSPDNKALIAAIGYNYLYLEDWDNAERYYKMITSKDSLDYEGNVHLGFIYQKKGDIDQAIRYYELALKNKPDDATTMGTLANLYEKKGDKAKQIEYLEKAVKAAPENYRFQSQLGSAYLDGKQFDKAIPIYQALANKFPDRAGYWRNLGLALSQTDRKKEAPAALEKALEIKGDDAYLLAVMAQVYNDTKQYSKAIEAIKRGLKAGNGQEPYLYYQWGIAYSKMKMYDEAIAKFEKVVSYHDPFWSKYAKKQIARQEKLKLIEKAKKSQGL